ncbi:MAG TPA: ATP-binding protein [Brevibacillus sp.]|nr:ATP-binding protein [Brevibacillus sp.]
MNILNFLFIAVPEGLVSIALGMSVFNMSVRQNVKGWLAAGVLFGGGSFTLTAMHVPYEPKIFTLFLYLCLLVYILVVRKVWLAVLISCTAYAAVNAAEFIILEAFNVFRISLDAILANPVYLYLAVWSYLFILLTVTIVLRKLRFDLQNLFPKKEINRYLLWMVLAGGVEFFILSVLLTRYFLQQTNTSSMLTVLNVPVLLVTSFVLFIALIFLFRKYLMLTVDRAVEEAEAPYTKNLTDLSIAVRSIKHDSMSHYQTILGFIKLRRYDMVEEYIRHLADEARDLIKIVQEVKNPVVAALLYGKMQQFTANQIDFQVRIQEGISQLEGWRDIDIAKVLGNLLDNAVMAALKVDESVRYIRMEWGVVGGDEYLYIENSGPTIGPDQLDRIFDLGYTTRESGRGGVGLAVVKAVVTKYKGTVKVRSEDGLTSFTITVPAGEKTKTASA